MILRITYILILTLSFSFSLLGQADAGDDKVISSGCSVEIGTMGNGVDCYHWDANPPDGSLVGQEDMPMPTVSPTATTTYTLTVAGENFTSRTMDDMTVSVEEMRVKEISFAGAGIHTITSDDGMTVYAAPHWLDANLDGDADDAGDKKYPVAYTRNSTIDLTVGIDMITAPTGTAANDVKIKGTGLGGIVFPETPATLAGTVASANITASNALVNEVEFFDPFAILWEISSDAGMTWCNISTTENRLYATLGAPTVPTLFHSLVHIGCDNADGNNAANAVVTAIYGEFTDRVVERIDNPGAMTYWDPVTPAPAPLCWTTAGLLELGDGRCGAWADFFHQLIQTQGIAGSAVAVVQVTPTLAITAASTTNLTNDIVNILMDVPGDYSLYPNALFFVKDWDVSAGVRSFNPADLAGAAGQGNPDPRAWFENHAIVKYNGMYYDPSYGSPVVATKNAWENQSLDGYGALITHTATMNRVFWLEELNTAALQVIISP